MLGKDTVFVGRSFLYLFPRWGLNPQDHPYWLCPSPGALLSMVMPSGTDERQSL